MKPQPAALAIAAHPDDIEFYMAGTLLLLKERGWAIHYFNLSRGDLGSAQLSSRETVRVRTREARAAARLLGARWHAPIAHDLRIFYADDTIRRVCAVVRLVRPAIILTHYPQDYMEDHMNACRVTLTAAFARGMPNYRSRPPRPAYDGDVAIYHAMPHLLRDPLGNLARPHGFANVTEHLQAKRQALAAHVSQKEWLDRSQGMDSYLNTMEATAREMGAMSRTFAYAEGWTRHWHVGYGFAKAQPLEDALGRNYCSASRRSTSARFQKPSAR